MRLAVLGLLSLFLVACGDAAGADAGLDAGLDAGSDADPTDAEPPDGAPGDDTGPSSVGEFRGTAIVSALNRFSVTKADLDRDLCFRLIVTEGVTSTLGITTPTGWGIEHAEVFDTAAACDEPWPGSTMGLPAATGTGSLTFPLPAPAVFPCAVDMDITLTFERVAPWAPATAPLAVMALPVAGCF